MTECHGTLTYWRFHEYNIHSFIYLFIRLGHAEQPAAIPVWVALRLPCSAPPLRILRPAYGTPFSRRCHRAPPSLRRFRYVVDFAFFSLFLIIPCLPRHHFPFRMNRLLPLRLRLFSCCTSKSPRSPHQLLAPRSPKAADKVNEGPAGSPSTITCGSPTPPPNVFWLLASLALPLLRRVCKGFYHFNFLSISFHDALRVSRVF